MKHVYVIAHGDTSFKIGISAIPQKRLDALQTAHNARLRLIGITVCRPDAMAVERKLHQALTKFRATGEWFICSLDDVLLAFEDAEIDLTLNKPTHPRLGEDMCTAEAFQRWHDEMRRRKDIESEDAIPRLLGSSAAEIAYFRAYGTDLRTALACRALFHRMEPWR